MIDLIDRTALLREVGINLTDARVDEWVRGISVPLHGREVSVDLRSRYLAATVRAAILTLIAAAPRAAIEPLTPKRKRIDWSNVVVDEGDEAP